MQGIIEAGFLGIMMDSRDYPDSENYLTKEKE